MSDQKLDLSVQKIQGTLLRFQKQILLLKAFHRWDHYENLMRDLSSRLHLNLRTLSDVALENLDRHHDLLAIRVRT